MTVKLTAPDGGEFDVSNGEWAAITAMGKVFGILEGPWDGNHGSGDDYNAHQLTALAQRARQIGKAADYLEELAQGGGASLS